MSDLEDRIKAMEAEHGPETRKLAIDTLAGFAEKLAIQDNSKLRTRIAELEAEVERMENLLAEGIHTCNPTCKRPLCVLRRENKELREELEVANEIGARHAKRVGEQAMELQALLKEGGDG
jgi:hypothetical protein